MWYNVSVDRNLLLERFAFFNPWWNGDGVPVSLAPEFKRSIFTSLKSYLDLDRVVVLKGPRRTGKSTVYYQLIDYLQKIQRVSPKNILYLSFVHWLQVKFFS